MSQVSQAQDPNWASIPVAKFSHSTLPIGAQNITWTHLNNRNDIELVIQSSRVFEGARNHLPQILMKITVGVDVLEIQDLAELARYYRDSDPSSRAENPVDVVVKNPFIAMRYPKSINTVRRIQLKFRNEHGFTRVLNFMTDLGLPIIDRGSSAPAVANTSTAILPSISPAPSLISSASSTSASTLSAEFPRPSSVTHFPSNRYGDISYASASSPIKSGFKVPGRPDSTLSNGYKPVSDMPYSTPQISRPYSTAFAPSMQASTPLMRFASFDRTTMPQAPLYLSQIERESQTRRVSQPILRPLSLANPNPKDSLFASQIQPQQPAQLAEDSDTRLLTASPFFPSQIVPAALESSFQGSASAKSFSNNPEFPRLSVQRPASTPLLHTEIQNLWIPPRRELPFPRPQDANRSRSSLSDLPLPPESTPVERRDLTTEARAVSDDTNSPLVTEAAPKRRVAQRKGLAAKANVQQPESAVAADTLIDGSLATEAVAQGQEVSPLAAKSAALAPRSSSEASRLVSKATASAKKRTAPVALASSPKRPKMVDQATQTQTLSGRDHSASQRKVPEIVPELVTDPTSPPDTYLDALDAFVTKHRDRPAPKELWETPGYADADQEYRDKILNDFICENLENPDFIQLCQDTEISWRRIGLGM